MQPTKPSAVRMAPPASGKPLRGAANSGGVPQSVSSGGGAAATATGKPSHKSPLSSLAATAPAAAPLPPPPPPSSAPPTSQARRRDPRVPINAASGSLPVTGAAAAASSAPSSPNRQRAVTSGGTAASRVSKGRQLTRERARAEAAAEEAVFTVSPKEVTFHSFDGSQRYEATLTFTNRTPQSQFIRVARPESRFFALTPPKGSDTTLKVAAGLSVVYTVVFIPEDADTDYHCDLHVTTDHDGSFLVPVRAYSSRGRLELPAELVIDQCPVKSSKGAPLFLRNAHASKPCTWRAEVIAGSGSEPLLPALPSCGVHGAREALFAISPSFGTVPAKGGSCAVEVLFTPSPAWPAGAQASRTICFFLGPEGDAVQDLVVRGVTAALPVSLAEPEVTFPATYVTTERQAVVRVTNASDCTVQFAWKDHYADPAMMGDATFLTSHRGSAGDASDSEASPASRDGPFDDEVFSIEPAQGVIYGRGTKEFTVTFNPQVAVPSQATAYLDVSGRADRLPLVLSGEGLGPQCKLDFTRLNIGEVHLNAEHEYTVELANVGGIEARYTVLSPDTELASRFHFSPAAGALAAGESQELSITLKSDIMGVVSETFHIHLHGSLKDIPLLFKGRIVGPTFAFDVAEVDFGDVSSGFWHSKRFAIVNTSQMPLQYRLRLSPACPNPDDYEVVPAHSVVDPNGQEAIELRYRASEKGDMQTELLVDVVDVGEAVEVLTVKARCQVPELYFSADVLPFGHCFVGHEYTAHVEVVNDTELSGRFAVVLAGDAEAVAAQAQIHIGEQEDGEAGDSDGQTAFSDDERRDGCDRRRLVKEGEAFLVIGPQQRVQVPIQLRAVHVGSITFAVSLRVCETKRRGSLGEDADDAQRHGCMGNSSMSSDLQGAGEEEEEASSSHRFRTVLVTASAYGPVIKAQPSGPISFGALPVLQTVPKTVSLLNTSPIPAAFALRLEKNGAETPHAVFSVEPTAGTIDPYGSVTVTVRACVDEASTFTDVLLVDVTHSPDGLASLPVKATGTGFPLVTDVDLSNFDVGDVFTETVVERTITLTNKGRKEQEVQWHNVRGAKVKEGAPPIVFRMKPERVYIAPRESATFTVEGLSANVGAFSDEFLLKQSSTFKEILHGRISGNFIPPLLTYSTRTLSFDFLHTAANRAGKPFATETKSFTVRNVTSKDLQVCLKIQEGTGVTPFSLDVEPTLTLSAGETRVIGVVFNPAYRTDRVPHEVKAKVRVSFVNHPRQESVALSAKLVYPGVELDPPADSAVDFGVVLKDTEERRVLTLTNPSTEIPASFEWKIVDEQDRDRLAGEDGASSSSVKEAASGVGKSEKACFDLVPFKGTIAPGASQRVEVVFYGHSGAHAAVAQCHIAGGTTHALKLIGSAGDVKLQYDRQELNFGLMPYYSEAQKTITITNPSRVTVAFQVALPANMRHPKSLRVSPMSGVLHDKVKLTVFFSPIVPDVTRETFTVQIAHFDPQPISVVGCGTVNTIAVTAADDKAATVTRSTGFNPAFQSALAELKAGGASHGNRNDKGSASASAPSDGLVPYAIRTAQRDDLVNLYKSQAHPDALEMEAERLALCAALVTTPPIVSSLSQKREATNLAQADTASLLSSAPPPTTAVPPPLDRAAVKKHYQANKHDDPLRRFNRRSSTTAMFDGSVKHVLARYVVDFGHMTRNDTRTTKVTLTNTCADRVFLLLDQKELASTPLIVSPVKLPPLDPLEATTVDITFDAAGAVMHPGGGAGGGELPRKQATGSTAGGAAQQPVPTIHPGENLFEFAVDVKNGPLVVVQCRCYVATPTLRIGETALDFGRVLLGQVRAKSVMLCNEQAIPCEWRLVCKEPTGKSQPKRLGFMAGLGPEERTSPSTDKGDKDGAEGEAAAPPQQFWTSVSQGVLAANESTTVDVFFAPFYQKKSVATLAFRFVSNPKVHEVRCEGEASVLAVALSPSPLVLPVIRPQQVATGTVTVTNTEDHAVELFAREADPIFCEETHILRRALPLLGDSAEQRLLMPARVATDPLPDDLLKAVYDALGQQAAAFVVDVREEDRDASLDEAVDGLHGKAAHASGPGGAGGKPEKGGKASARGAKAKTRQSKSVAGQGGAVEGKLDGTGTFESTGDAKQMRAATPLSGTLAGVASVLDGDGSGQGQGQKGRIAGVKPTTVLLVGPPESGKSTQAALLQARLGLDAIDLNTLVLAEAERDTASGEVIRDILTVLVRRARAEAPQGPQPPPQLASLNATAKAIAQGGFAHGSDVDDNDDDGEAPLAFEDERTLTATWLQNTVANSDHLRSLLSRTIDERTGNLTPRGATDSAAHGRKGNPLRDTTGTNADPQAAAGDEDADALAKYERFIPGILKSLLRAEMESLMRQRETDVFADSAGGPGCVTGFIFDDVRCCLTANKRLLFEAVKEVCDLLGSRLLVYSLAISEADVGLRSAAAAQRVAEERAAAAHITPLSEADYELLTPLEREAYNLQLKYYNECRRELKRATKRRERYQAILNDGPQLSVQDAVEEERELAQTARMDASASAKGAGLRKVTVAAKKTDAPDFAEPAWDTLDEMQSFRELWGYLLHQAEVAESAPPVKGPRGKSISPVVSGRSAAGGASGKKYLGGAVANAPLSALNASGAEVSAATALPIRMAGDQSLEALTENIVHSVAAFAAATGATPPGAAGGLASKPSAQESAPEDGAARPKAGVEEDGAGPAPPGASKPVDDNAHAERRTRGVKWPDLLSSCGNTDRLWSYLDAARFSAMLADISAPQSAAEGGAGLARCVRFLALTEREVAAPVNPPPAQQKKGAAKAKPPSTVVRNWEPMSRWVIPARSTLELTVEFRCATAGVYRIPCDFGVVGSLQKLTLTVEAQAALPDMCRDDKRIFPTCRAKPPATGRPPAKVFWSGKRVFDFGALLVPAQVSKRRRSERGPHLLAPPAASPQAPQSPSQPQPPQRPLQDASGKGLAGAAGGISSPSLAEVLPPATAEELLTFTNDSVATAEVTLSFENDKDRCFSVHPTSFTLPVGGSEQVRLRATPETVGEMTNRLLATVKDNPTPWSVTVACTGSRPSLTVGGEKEAELDFGRSALNRASELSMRLANACRTPVRWTLLGCEKLPAELQVSETSGVLEESGARDVTFTFHPTSTCLHSIPLQIQVSDAGTGPRPATPTTVYETIPVTVKAEGHDIILEWTKEVDFQLMHVGETKKEVLRVLNKSPYDVGYMIRLPKRLQNTITISPQTGTIRGMLGHKDAAVANVEVTARFEKEGEIHKRLGQLEVAFFDPVEQELVYPLQTVPVRGEAWHTRYAVKPSCIDFGSCLFDQRKQSTLELQNTGRFPVTFTLFDYKEGHDYLRKESGGDAAVAAQGTGEGSTAGSPATGNGSVANTNNSSVMGGNGASTTSAKRPAAPKSSKNSDGGEYRLGCFTVSPARGTVPVGESVTLHVTTIPSRTSRTRETLGIFVDRSHPELEAKGTPVELLAHPATPGIAADLTSPSDVETIFEEQQVVFRLAQFDWKAKAYGKEDKAFSFGTTLVGHRTEERFRIANTSPLPCTVIAQLVSATGSLPIAGLNGAGGAAVSLSSKASASVARPDGFDIRYDGSTSRDAVFAGLIAEANASTGGESAGKALPTSGRKGRSDRGASSSVEAGGGAVENAILAPSPPGTVRLILPPFESRFVTIGFTPGSLQRFEARFLATVENGSDSRTNCLAFHLLGAGTLPNVEYVLPPPLVLKPLGSGVSLTADGSPRHPSKVAGSGSGSPTPTKSPSLVSSTGSASGKKGSAAGTGGGHRDVSRPSGVSHDGAVGGGGGGTGQDVIQLPLTRLGAHSSRYFTIRNVGDVPADVRVSLASDERLAEGLRVAKRNQDISIAVGSEEVFEIHYAPTAVGRATLKLRVSLLDNPFEDKELMVEAQSFSQPISFENIDAAATDFVDLGDCYVGQPRVHTFAMRNNTASRLRFAWRCPGSRSPATSSTSEAAAAATVAMSPSVGHIAPGAVKTITAHLLCTEAALPTSISASHGASPGLRVLPCEVEAQSIELLDGPTDGLTGEVAEWDSSLMNQKWAVASVMDASGTSPGAERPHSGLAGDAGRRNLRKVLEPVPEPDYHLTDATTCTQPLRIGYVCERPHYELVLVNKKSGAGVTQPLEAIAFETTKMFQRRIATVRVVNTGGVTLPFQCQTMPQARGGKGDAVGAGKSPTDAEASTASATGKAEASVAAAGERSEFSVTPSEGTVPVGGSVDLSVIFSPRTAALATGVLAMEFPFSDRPLREVALSGNGECPLVHFHIPPSTYLESRIDGEAGAIGDAETLVVEFMTRGLHNRTTVKFKVVNPTALSYPFEWVERSSPGSFSPFRCLTRAGTLAAGKQLEMAFEFSADTLGTREALWAFDIPGKASVPFLLVGKAVEPDVLFTTSKLHFGCVNVRSRVEKTIVIENRDVIPFGFAFDKLDGQTTSPVDGASGGGGGFSGDGAADGVGRRKPHSKTSSAYLTVRPASGVIGPKERLPITVCFAPVDEMEYNVPLVCRIKKASTPLTVNVKGEGISTHDSLYIEAPEVSGARDSSSTAQPLVATRGQLLPLNLGRVQVDERVTRRFVLTNTGHYPFDYAVSAPERRFITLENTQGTVAPRQRAVVTFVYHPTVEESLRQYRLTVRTGVERTSYQIGVQAVTYIPKLHLGFERYDFGPRFISEYNPRNEPSTALTLTNNDKEPITVDCAMTEGNDWCRLDNTSLLVKPHEKSELRLSFTPREVRLYDDKLKLLLNGVYPVYVPISGEGVVPRVEVLNHIAKLGVARVGEKREVELRIACRSRIPTPVSFSGCVDDDLQQKGIAISSAETLVLKPREVRSITVTFKPPRRMGEFQREMRMLVCGRECPFALLTGACEDSEIHLDTRQLRFEDVVVGSSATRRLVIMNSGDISQKFSWGLRHGGELTVNAPSAFLRAHTEFVCEFTYTPARADSHLRRTIEVTFDNAPPVTVTVEANAMSRPAAKSCVLFRCRARETDTQRITVENAFNQPWSFRPVLDQELWSVPRASEAAVTIKPKGKAEIAVQYAPVKETAEASPDFGTMFIPKPDGTGLTFTLQGHADAPGPSAPLTEVEMEAKAEHSVTFPVCNWASVPLRFTREVVWSPEPEDGLIAVRGTSGVEVPPDTSKMCSLELCCMREGAYNGTVYFRCGERPEMVQYFEVALRVSGQPNAVVQDLRAAVRSGASHAIPVSNPLTKAVTIATKVELVAAANSPASGTGGSHTTSASASTSSPTSLADYFIVPATVTIPAKSAVTLPVQFFPLVHRDYAPVRVVLSSAELGVSRYVYRLFSSPPPLEKPTQLVCPLGQSVTFALRFAHFCHSNVDFAVHLSGSGGSARGRSGGNATGTDQVGPSSATTQGSANAFGVITVNRGGGGGGGNAGGGTTSSSAAASTLKAPAGPGWPRGQEVGMEFCYEPQVVGKLKEVVEFISATGGTYTFPIIATCTDPERQGPVLIKPGSQNTQIPFKNVFFDAITISIASDNPSCFIVVKKTETIPAKKSVNITVQFKAPPSSTAAGAALHAGGDSVRSKASASTSGTFPGAAAQEDGVSDVVRGKLMVTCVPPGQTTPVEWVYYLEAGRGDKEVPGGRRATIRRK